MGGTKTLKALILGKLPKESFIFQSRAYLWRKTPGTGNFTPFDFAQFRKLVFSQTSKQTLGSGLSMSKTIYIGKVPKTAGKRVFEILCNLKNFGKGRILVKNSDKDKPEKNYVKVVDAWPQMDDELSYGRVFVEEVLEGKLVPGVSELKHLWLADYSLIPKEEEEEFVLKNPPVWGEPGTMVLQPKYMQAPPLLAEFLNRKRLGIKPCTVFKGLDRTKHGYDAESIIDFKIPYVYSDTRYTRIKFRVADEEKGEKPTMEDRQNPIIYERLMQGVKEI